MAPLRSRLRPVGRTMSKCGRKAISAYIFSIVYGLRSFRWFSRCCLQVSSPLQLHGCAGRDVHWCWVGDVCDPCAILLFSLFLKLNLTDHPLSVILSYIAFNMPITIMILLGFYYALPREVEEAAVMDGCSVNRIFFRIVLPMTASVIATTAIINMIYDWNEFIFVNTFISSDAYKTLTVGVQNFIGQYTTDWGAIGATLMISILPILIAFLVLSERIVEGLRQGSVKG